MVSKPDKKNATPAIVDSVWKKSTCPQDGECGPCHLRVPETGNSSSQEIVKKTWIHFKGI